MLPSLPMLVSSPYHEVCHSTSINEKTKGIQKNVESSSEIQKNDKSSLEIQKNDKCPLEIQNNVENPLETQNIVEHPLESQKNVEKPIETHNNVGNPLETQRNLENPSVKTTEQQSFSGAVNSEATPHEKDNEDDLAALMKASSTIKTPGRSVGKKKPPQIRQLEKTLNCLLADNEEIKDEKSFAFAQAFFLKVTETLHEKDDTTYQEFLKTLNDFGQTIFDVPELYHKITKILSNYPDLCEEFLAFLLPEQAMACGKFMDYIMITKMKGFCRKLELYYSKQPSHLRKIFMSLSDLAANKNATLKDIRDTLFPLLRNNSFLINMLLELMPTTAPHESSLTHYESMDFQGSDKPKDLFETVAIPGPAEDSYGGSQCVCSCHKPEEEGDGRKESHCVSCGAKFIQGRIYFQSGKMLHPAKVSFREEGAAERLSAKIIRSNVLKKKPPAGSKKGSSKNDAVSSSGSAQKGQSKSPKRVGKGKVADETAKKSSGKSLPGSKAANNKVKVANAKKKPQKDVKLPKGTSRDKSPSKLKDVKKSVSQIGKRPLKNMGKVKKNAPEPISPRAARLSGRHIASKIAESNAAKNKKPGGNLPIILRIKTECITTPKTEPDSCQENNRELSSDSRKVPEESDLEHKTSAVEREGEAKPSDNEANPSVCEEDSTPQDVEMKDDLENEDHDPTVSESDEEMKDLDTEENEVGCSEDIVDSEMKEDMDSLERDLATSDSEEEAKGVDVEESETAGEEDNTNGNVEMKDLENEEREDVEEHESAPNSSDSHSSGIKNNVSISDDSSVDFQDDAVCENLDAAPEPLDVGDVPESGIAIGCKRKREGTLEDESAALQVCDLDDIPSDTSGGTDKEDDVIDIEGECSEEEMEESIIVPPRDYSRDSNSSRDVFEESTSMSWTREEDKIILQTFQTEAIMEHVFQKICELLPHRTLEEVQSRFETLMSFLKKMAGD